MTVTFDVHDDAQWRIYTVQLARVPFKIEKISTRNIQNW